MSETLQREFVGINEAALDDLRKRIGVKIENTLEPWCYEATRDNIRHYAHGIGDDNPLWCDPDYGTKSRWEGVIAPPPLVGGDTLPVRSCFTSPSVASLTISYSGLAPSTAVPPIFLSALSGSSFNATWAK